VEIVAYQDRGASLNVLGYGEDTTYFWIRRVA